MMKQILRSLKIAAGIKGSRLSGEKLLVVRGFTSSAQTTGNRSWPTSSPKTNFSRTGSRVRTAMYFSTIATESLESLGESISTAVLLSWSKSPGDKVEEGDVVATVETEKVTVDIRAKQKGVFAEALAKEKDEVKVGQNLYRIVVSPPDQPAHPKQQQPGQGSTEKSKPSDSTTASSSTSGSSSGAVVQVKVPAMGESITGGTVSKWFFREGNHVKEDEVVAIIETDKVNCDVRSPHSGVITKLHVAADADVSVDDELFELAPDDVSGAKESEQSQSIQSQLPSQEKAKDSSKVASSPKEKSTKRKTSRERAAEAAPVSSSSSRENLAKAHSGEWEEGSTGVHGMERQPAAPSSALDKGVKNEGSEKKQQTGRNLINRANPFDEIALKPKDTLEEREKNKYPGYTEDVYDRAEPSTYSPSVDKKTTPTPTASSRGQSEDSTEEEAKTTAAVFGVQRGERREKMSRLRQSVATRLKDTQNSAAMLTTFQETDMSALIAMRNKHKGDFEKLHGVKLGFMSAFVKASTAALAQLPLVNAAIDWQAREIVHRSYVDVSVAVQSPRGLVVPVLRDADKMSCAEIEKAIATFGKKAKDGTLTADEMNGGTFTISNGGVFGSLFSTPIINQPQSAILGMHATKLRPVVVTNAYGVHSVEARPMMYLALSYDHRLVDGRDAVVFLKSVSDKVEDPQRLLLGL